MIFIKFISILFICCNINGEINANEVTLFQKLFGDIAESNYNGESLADFSEVGR